MASANVRVQDMPPAGGYSAINYKRVPAKSLIGGWKLIGGYLGLSAIGWYLYFLSYRVVERERLEMRSAGFALYPLLQAERDREYLKQLRRNRDEEASLMKNVEGWKVGTYYGEPIYRTVPEDTLIEPRTLAEHFVHANPKDYRKKQYMEFWI